MILNHSRNIAEKFAGELFKKLSTASHLKQSPLIMFLTLQIPLSSIVLMLCSESNQQALKCKNKIS